MAKKKTTKPEPEVKTDWSKITLADPDEEKQRSLFSAIKDQLQAAYPDDSFSIRVIVSLLATGFMGRDHDEQGQILHYTGLTIGKDDKFVEFNPD